MPWRSWVRFLSDDVFLFMHAYAQRPQRWLLVCELFTRSCVKIVPSQSVHPLACVRLGVCMSVQRLRGRLSVRASTNTWMRTGEMRRGGLQPDADSISSLFLVGEENSGA